MAINSNILHLSDIAMAKQRGGYRSAVSNSSSSTCFFRFASCQFSLIRSIAKDQGITATELVSRAIFWGAVWQLNPPGLNGFAKLASSDSHQVRIIKVPYPIKKEWLEWCSFHQIAPSPAAFWLISAYSQPEPPNDYHRYGTSAAFVRSDDSSVLTIADRYQPQNYQRSASA